MLYRITGQMYSLVFAAQSKTIKERPDVCDRFMQGTMEGLAYTYLHPNESGRHPPEQVKEFRASLPTGDVVSTARA